jgi:hypothetical protein
MGELIIHTPGEDNMVEECGNKMHMENIHIFMIK